MHKIVSGVHRYCHLIPASEPIIQKVAFLTPLSLLALKTIKLVMAENIAETAIQTSTLGKRSDHTIFCVLLGISVNSLPVNFAIIICQTSPNAIWTGPSPTPIIIDMTEKISKIKINNRGDFLTILRMLFE